LAVAQGNGHGHDKHDRDDDNDRRYDRDDRDHSHGNGNGHNKGNGHGRYADRDGDLRGWYRTHYNHLPPGLERQLIVRGTLPPGLRGRMQPCPRELEVMLPPPPPNYVHVVIGGNLVLYNRADFQIADVFPFEIN
jgi:hypothetical protein